MTESTNTELLLAIHGVTQAIERMDARIASMEALERAAKDARAKRLDMLVSEAIPEISPRVFGRLRKEHPAFAARAKVEASFIANRKILGVFKRSTYDIALLVLKTELKAFLDGSGAARAQDEELRQSSAEKSSLYEQRQEAIRVLDSLQRMLRSGSQVGASEKEINKHLAIKGRSLAHPSKNDLGRPLARPSIPTSQHTPIDSWGTSTNISDGGDLWVWMLTDIPTSARTLVGSMMAASHRSAASVERNSAATREEPCEEKSSSAEKRLEEVEESVQPQSLQCSREESSEAIATDDSLGRFS